MAYDPINSPARQVRASGIEGIAGTFSFGPGGAQLAASSFAAEWAMDTNGDDITVVASTPGYVSNAAALHMRRGDIIWIRNNSNGRVWRALLSSVSPDGTGTIGDYGTADIGQESAAEAGWNSLVGAGAVGAMVRFTPLAWPVINVTGTFGAGGSVSLQGSTDGATWTALSPPPLTAPGTFKGLQSTERYIWGRPVVTGGDATTNLNVSF